MKRYLLISVIDREIFTSEFDTLTQARTQMRNEYIDSASMGCEEWELKEKEAYVTDGNHHSDYDWKIIELF